jgi:hypothetical protein
MIVVERMKMVTSAGRVYNLVSGSLNIGSALMNQLQQLGYSAPNGQGWGLFYPDAWELCC